MNVGAGGEGRTPDPAEAGQMLVLLHDGALAAAQLDDPKAVHGAVRHAALKLLDVG